MTAPADPAPGRVPPPARRGHHLTPRTRSALLRSARALGCLVMSAEFLFLLPSPGLLHWVRVAGTALGVFLAVYEIAGRPRSPFTARARARRSASRTSPGNPS